MLSDLAFLRKTSNTASFFPKILMRVVVQRTLAPAQTTLVACFQIMCVVYFSFVLTIFSTKSLASWSFCLDNRAFTNEDWILPSTSVPIFDFEILITASGIPIFSTSFG